MSMSGDCRELPPTVTDRIFHESTVSSLAIVSGLTWVGDHHNLPDCLDTDKMADCAGANHCLWRLAHVTNRRIPTCPIRRVSGCDVFHDSLLYIPILPRSVAVLFECQSTLEVSSLQEEFCPLLSFCYYYCSFLNRTHYHHEGVALVFSSGRTCRRMC